MIPDLANLPKDFISRDCPKCARLSAAPSGDLRSSPSAAPAQKPNPESRVRPHQATLAARRKPSDTFHISGTAQAVRCFTLAARRKPSGTPTLAARRKPSGAIHISGTAQAVRCFTLAARREPSGAIHLSGTARAVRCLHASGTARGRVPVARPRCGRITPPKGRDRAIVDFLGIDLIAARALFRPSNRPVARSATRLRSGEHSGFSLTRRASFKSITSREQQRSQPDQIASHDPGRLNMLHQRSITPAARTCSARGLGPA
jgi:hypothetical protein